MSKQNAWVAVFLIFLAHSNSFAGSKIVGGPSTGGGGDVVRLPNDKIVLADTFLDHGAIQPNNMPPKRAINPRLLQAVDAYLKVSKSMLESLSPKTSDIVKQMEMLRTRKNELSFYAVQDQKELNTFCAPGGKKTYKLPSGAVAEQAACTAGLETFLVEPLFVKLNIREQALLLVHERLTTLRDKQGGKNYSAIARFTTGMNLYLDLYNEQVSDKYRKLNPKEFEKMHELYTAIEEIERRNSEITDTSFEWTAAKIGGGRVHNQIRIDESSIVGLNFVVLKGSVLGREAKLLFAKNYVTAKFNMQNESLLDKVTIELDNENSEIAVGSNSSAIDSTIKGSLSLQNDTHIQGSNLNEVKVDSNVRILNSTLAGVTLASNSTVENSNLSNAYVGDNCKINGSQTNAIALIRIGSASQLTNSSITYLGKSDLYKSQVSLVGKEIRLADNSILKDSIIDDLSLETYPVGTKLKKYSAQWNKSISIREHLGDNISSRDSLGERDGYQFNIIAAQPLIDFSGHFMFKNEYRSSGFFNSDYYANFYSASYSLNISPSIANVDQRPNSFTVDDKGVIQKTGPAKFIDVDAFAGRTSIRFRALSKQAIADLKENITQYTGAGLYFNRYLKIPVE